MKFSTVCLASAFSAVAVSAAFVAYKTLETAHDPHRPNYLGYTILGQMTESHYPKYGRAGRYDEYLRDRYLTSPQMAYDNLKRVYGIEFKGDHIETYGQFVRGWAGKLTPEDKSVERSFIRAATDRGEYDNKGAMLMFLSLKAYGREVYNINDGIGLCNDIIGENNKRIGNGSPLVQQCDPQ